MGRSIEGYKAKKKRRIKRGGSFYRKLYMKERDGVVNEKSIFSKLLLGPEKRVEDLLVELEEVK